jgi:competence protein ComEC
MSGGARELLRTMPAREVWCSPWARASPSTIQVLREAQAQGAQIRRLAAGSLVRVGPLEYETLYPDGTESVRTRAEPLVLRAQWGRGAVLFAGGISDSVEASILAGEADPGADIMLVGGRIRRAACSPMWLEAVKPRTVVLAIGAEGQWVEPSSEWLHRITEAGAKLVRTDREGMAVFEWCPKAASPTSFKRLPSSGASDLL